MASTTIPAKRCSSRLVRCNDHAPALLKRAGALLPIRQPSSRDGCQTIERRANLRIAGVSVGAFATVTQRALRRTRAAQDPEHFGCDRTFSAHALSVAHPQSAGTHCHRDRRAKGPKTGAPPADRRDIPGPTGFASEPFAQRGARWAVARRPPGRMRALALLVWEQWPRRAGSPRQMCLRRAKPVTLPRRSACHLKHKAHPRLEPFHLAQPKRARQTKDFGGVRICSTFQHDGTNTPHERITVPRGLSCETDRAACRVPPRPRPEAPRESRATRAPPTRPPG